MGSVRKFLYFGKRYKGLTKGRSMNPRPLIRMCCVCLRVKFKGKYIPLYNYFMKRFKNISHGLCGEKECEELFKKGETK